MFPSGLQLGKEENEFWRKRFLGKLQVLDVHVFFCLNWGYIVSSVIILFEVVFKLGVFHSFTSYRKSGKVGHYLASSVSLEFCLHDIEKKSNENLKVNLNGFLHLADNKDVPGM